MSTNNTGVQVETKRETVNDDRAAQYTAEVAKAGGALTVRGIPYEVKRLEAVAEAAKNGTIIAIIDV
jgi:hypothetical protein